MLALLTSLLACRTSPPPVEPPFEPEEHQATPSLPEETECDQPEVPYNDLDDDCDPNTPDDDLDGDGFLLADDCDDTDPLTHPDGIDLPRDGIDQDCTGQDRCRNPAVIGQFLAFKGPDAANDMAEACEGHPDGAAVEYWLDIDATTSTDLSELSCLCEIRGGLGIADNPELTSLAGLSSVEEIDGSVFIFGNDALASLEGLDSLRSAGYGPLGSSTSTFSVSGTSVTSLEGLSALEEVRHLSLSTMPVESLSGLESLTRVGNLAVTYCYELRDLTGLESLKVIGDDSDLFHGHAWIYANSALLSLDGFAPTEIQNGLFLYSNGELDHIDSLDSLQSIGGNLFVDDLAALQQLDALHGLDSVGGDVTITDNPSMTDEEGWDLVDAIETIGGTAVVSGNGSPPKP